MHPRTDKMKTIVELTVPISAIANNVYAMIKNALLPENIQYAASLVESLRGETIPTA